MKKILTVTFYCILISNVFAQKPKIKYGLKAGVNYAKFAIAGGIVTDEAKDDITGLISFHVGGFADIPVLKSFYLQPGLSLNGKGYKAESTGFGTNSILSTKATIFYLELPVNTIYKTHGFYFGTGPYAAFAIAGKNYIEFINNGVNPPETTKADEDLEFGNNSKDDYKRLDFGLNVLAGYQLKNGINVGANYGLGLSNITRGENADFKQKNRVVSVSVGYIF
ncbi:MAG: porin family protein [Daejeonella sp.]